MRRVTFLVLLTMDRGGPIGDEWVFDRDLLPERGLAHGEGQIGVAEKDYFDRKEQDV